jgi:hypothetical protein
MDTRINKKKVAGYGLLTWLIPFIASLLFFSKSGQPVLPIDLVKSIMILIGASTGGYLLYRLFKESAPSLAGGVLIGLVWFLMNIFLDLAILVPMTKMNLDAYFFSNRIAILVDSDHGRCDGRDWIEATNRTLGASLRDEFRASLERRSKGVLK